MPRKKKESMFGGAMPMQPGGGMMKGKGKAKKGKKPPMKKGKKGKMPFMK